MKSDNLFIQILEILSIRYSLQYAVPIRKRKNFDPKEMRSVIDVSLFKSYLSSNEILYNNETPLNIVRNNASYRLLARIDKE